jgi:hypothetical protein
MCDLCQSADPAVHVTMQHNIGMLIMRQVHTTDARVCRACLGRSFRKHRLFNFFLGWWGTISFFMTAWYLLNNTLTFFSAGKEIRELGIRRAAMQPERNEPPRERLKPFRHNVVLRLRNLETPEAIASDLSRTHAVPVSDALAFVHEVRGGQELTASL